MNIFSLYVPHMFLQFRESVLNVPQVLEVSCFYFFPTVSLSSWCRFYASVFWRFRLPPIFNFVWLQSFLVLQFVDFSHDVYIEKSKARQYFKSISPVNMLYPMQNYRLFSLSLTFLLFLSLQLQQWLCRTAVIGKPSQKSRDLNILHSLCAKNYEWKELRGSVVP